VLGCAQDLNGAGYSVDSENIGQRTRRFAVCCHQSFSVSSVPPVVRPLLMVSRTLTRVAQPVDSPSVSPERIQSATECARETFDSSPRERKILLQSARQTAATRNKATYHTVNNKKVDTICHDGKNCCHFVAIARKRTISYAIIRSHKASYS
jgi:hypothetical protein